MSKDKKEKAKLEEENPSSEDKKLLKEIDELKEKNKEINQKFEEADKLADEWKNKYYMAYADMANVRKQVEKESADFKKYAIEGLVKEIIPTLDAFDMALKSEPKDENIKKYLEGFKMVHSKLLNTLSAQGIVVISPNVGDEYNPNLMEAFSVIEGEEDNKIADVFVKGYKLGDHLLRPAGVIITKKCEQPAESNEDKKEENN